MTRASDVGYRKPPEATRFKPGKSGNPKGRPTAVLALYARVITETPEAEGQPIEDDELLIIRRFGPRLLKSLGKKETRDED
jgi:hypothetical protein